MHQIAILSADRLGSSPAAITLDVLRIAERVAGRSLFLVEVFALSADSGALPPSGGPLASLPAFRPAALIVPGLGLDLSHGPDILLASPDGATAASVLRTTHADGAWIAVSCAATFLAGAAGLLDHGPATTSWWLAPQFRARFPKVDLQDGALTTEHGRVLCGAGMLAHIELMLVLLGKFLDRDIVEQVGRYLVSPRRGPQSAQARVQDIPLRDPMMASVVAMIRKNIEAPMTVDSLAAVAATSKRTLERRIRSAFGTSPVGLIQRIRAEVALDLLLSTERPLKWVAEQVGYEDANTLRQLLVRKTGLTPRAIRRLG